MQGTLAPHTLPESGHSAENRRTRLLHVIEHAAELLPAQGPINVFIHHNTLHAFEDLTFDEGVRQGGKIFGCNPWLPEERYREKLDRGRIQREDLIDVLREDLGRRADERLAVDGTRLELRLAMLEHPLRFGPTEELRWFVAETDALLRFRPETPPAVREQMIDETKHWVVRDLRRQGAGGAHPLPVLDDLMRRFGEAEIDNWSRETWEAFTLQALWRICRHGVHGVPFGPPPPMPLRHRDLLLRATGVDCDVMVHDLLIKFCAAFTDQGLAHWHLPLREEGFLESFSAVYRMPAPLAERWMNGLRRELARMQESGQSAVDSVAESLDLLGVPEDDWQDFLTGTLLALRGWGGMLRQMELRRDRVVHGARDGTIIEFLAVRLILDRLAAVHVAREELDYTGPVSGLRAAVDATVSHHVHLSVEQRAFSVFQLAQVRGWRPRILNLHSRDQWHALLQEIEGFSPLERRRIYHLAFERRFRIQVLDAVTLHARRSNQRPAPPRFQIVCCLDEREESFRRHMEEICPDVETFGVAGFFSAAMYYRGAADAHFVPLCPVVIRPQHWVAEYVAYTKKEEHEQRTATRRLLGRLSHWAHWASRTFMGGAILTAGAGVLASIPLLSRVLFPRLHGRVLRRAGGMLGPPDLTRLQLERVTPQAGPESTQLGYSLAEMVNIGERLLRDIGLISGFARLVVFLGHGSTSLNNPHKSAYDCGACGGGMGGPNARAAAEILNDLRVREALAQRGIVIPRETAFVGGLHNTCADRVTFFDLDRIPLSHQQEFSEFDGYIERTCDRNAHERCRRFMSAPLTMTFEEARQHVEERAEDLAQTRPECGHATNAICVVGRRSRTRGLYFDRRAFLTSYDPTQDDAESSILTRILQAVFPVCAGINLEYYFSYVDPTGWGCGTKLPHNIASLLGVMDGAASDLRTGLPWQMVEIHEPVRLQFVIETTPEAMTRIMERNEGIRKLCANRWVQLALLSPDSGEIQVYGNNRFEPYQPEARELPKVAASTDWYRGWRDHLGFAEVEPPNS